MTVEAGYGGWFHNQPAPTGSTSNANKAVHWLAVTLLAVGTGGVIDAHLLQQHQRQIDSSSLAILKVPTTEAAPVRSPAEDLAHIREILSPAISDLAKTLDVSRQTVYNWANGEQPKDEHLAKLRDLAQAADAISNAGIVVTGLLLKRKIVDGKSLLESGRDSESFRDVAQLLIQVIRSETAQQERMAARFSGRVSSSRSVESDFPAANDVS